MMKNMALGTSQPIGCCAGPSGLEQPSLAEELTPASSQSRLGTNSRHGPSLEPRLASSLQQRQVMADQLQKVQFKINQLKSQLDHRRQLVPGSGSTITAASTRTSSGQDKVTAARLRTAGKPPLHQVEQISKLKGKQQLKVGIKNDLQKETGLQPASSKSHEDVSPVGENPTMHMREESNNNLRKSTTALISNLPCGIRRNQRISRDINGVSSDREKKKRLREKKKLTEEQIVDLLEISSSEDENDGEVLSNTEVGKKLTRASVVSSKTRPEVEIIILSESESSTSPGIETIHLSDSESISGEEFSGCEQQQAGLPVVYSVPPLPKFTKMELKALREKKKSSKDSKFDWNMNELDTDLIEMRRNVKENLTSSAFTDQWNPWKDILLKQIIQPEVSSGAPKPSEDKEGAFENDESSREGKMAIEIDGIDDTKKSSWDETRKEAKKSNEKVYILPDKMDFVAKLGLIPSSVLFEKMKQRDEERFEARNSRQLRSRRAAKIP